MADEKRRRGRPRLEKIPRPKCPNQACAEPHNIILNGEYRTFEGMGRRYLCRSCGNSFGARAGSTLENCKSSTWKVLESIRILSKGASIRLASRLTGLKPDTIKRWLMKISRDPGEYEVELLNWPGMVESELRALFESASKNDLKGRGIEWRKSRGWRKGWE